MKISTCHSAQMVQHEINKHWQCAECGSCTRFETMTVKQWRKWNPGKEFKSLKVLMKKRGITV